MRRFIALAVVALAAFSAQQAHAQRYQGSSDNPIGPTVSPYLNLLSSDSFGITNYQSLVRPLVQQGNAINRQGGAINRLQQQMSAPRGGYGGATGHATFFMNYSHFYSMPGQ
jgi:hypothetical protein